MKRDRLVRISSSFRRMVGMENIVLYLGQRAKCRILSGIDKIMALRRTNASTKQMSTLNRGLILCGWPPECYRVLPLLSQVSQADAKVS